MPQLELSHQSKVFQAKRYRVAVTMQGEPDTITAESEERSGVDISSRFACRTQLLCPHVAVTG